MGAVEYAVALPVHVCVHVCMCVHMRMRVVCGVWCKHPFCFAHVHVWCVVQTPLLLAATDCLAGLRPP